MAAMMLIACLLNVTAVYGPGCDQQMQRPYEAGNRKPFGQEIEDLAGLTPVDQMDGYVASPSQSESHIVSEEQYVLAVHHDLEGEWNEHEVAISGNAVVFQKRDEHDYMYTSQCMISNAVGTLQGLRADDSHDAAVEEAHRRLICEMDVMPECIEKLFDPAV